MRGSSWLVIAFLSAACATEVLYEAVDVPALEEREPPAVQPDEDLDAEPTDVLGLPGEYEPVERVLFGWHAGNWGYLRYFATVMRIVVNEAIARVAVESASEEVALREALAEHGVDTTRVEFAVHALDSMWIRDYGPVLVRTKDGGHRVIDLPYHADRAGDDAYPARFAEDEGLPISRLPIRLEGGHLQSDGEGRCVVTDDVLRRAGSPSAEELERLLRVYFGCQRSVIVPRLYAEETGHVDVFAYITGPAQILVGRYRPEDDLVNSRRLDRAARLLREAGFKVTRIPMPNNSRRRVFRTYTNLLVLDRTVLVPVFRREREHERRALWAIARAFPERRIVPIRADGVMGLAGALHCTTVTLPALRSELPRGPRLARRRG